MWDVVWPLTQCKGWKELGSDDRRKASQGEGISGVKVMRQHHDMCGKLRLAETEAILSIRQKIKLECMGLQSSELIWMDGVGRSSEQ